MINPGKGNLTNYRVKKEEDDDDEDWTADAPMPDDELPSSSYSMPKKSKEFTSFLTQFGLSPTPGPSKTLRTPSRNLTNYNEKNQRQVQPPPEEKRPEKDPSMTPPCSSINPTNSYQSEKPAVSDAPLETRVETRVETRDETRYETRDGTNYETNDSDDDSYMVSVYPDEVDLEDEDDRVLFPEAFVMTNPDHWATVYYYEGTERIGTPFEVQDLEFFIDGRPSKNPDRNRMSIAGNPVNTTWKANAIRNQFGAGVHFIRENGSVLLKCLTESPIFVQCPQVAELRGEVPNTIYRLQKNAGQASELAVFDEPYFEQIMEKRRNLANDNFYMLHSHCIIRISFVKGFGTDYPRQLITQCPCWVEVQMVHKLALFDEIIRNVHRNMTSMAGIGSFT